MWPLMIKCYVGYATNENQKYLLMQILYAFRNQVEIVKRMFLFKAFNYKQIGLKGALKQEYRIENDQIRISSFVLG